MSPEETFYHSYELRQAKGQTISLEQPFVLREVAGEQNRREFHNFEQMMNFLLDKLFDGPDKLPNS